MTNQPHVHPVDDKSYYQQANHWHEEMVSAKERQIMIYRNLNGVFILLLTLAMMSIITLITREKVQPFLAIMDKRTGEVTTPARLTSQTLPTNWNMIRHFVTTYVMQREQYNFLNINEPYQAVLAMSNAPVKDQFNQVIRPELNPQSPITQLGQQHHITVTIHSIAKLNSDHLLDIRFTTHVMNSQTNQMEHDNAWRATLRWSLVNKKRSLSEWDKNPLGFTVLFYDKQPIVS